MRSKNISVIPVTKRTFKPLSNLLFLDPKSKLFRPGLDAFNHRLCAENQTMSWH